MTLTSSATIDEDESGTITLEDSDGIYTFDDPISVSTSITSPDTNKVLKISIPYRTTGTGEASDDLIGTVTVPLVSSAAITETATFSGSPRASSTLLDAKAQAYRYILFTHSIGGSSGQAELRGNDAVIALGEGFTGTVSGHAGTVGTVDQQSGTLMHEVGHLLNLQHGGPRYTLAFPDITLTSTIENCVPFHNSVMSYTGQFTTYKGGNWTLGYSDLDGVSLSETGLDETVGLSIAGTPYMLWSTPDEGVALQPYLEDLADGPKDWNGDGDETDSSFGTPQDLNDFGVFGCKASPSSEFEAVSEWDNLDFDFRQGPTGQFDGGEDFSIPPPSDIQVIGHAQQVIANYQTHGMEKPLEPDGSSGFKPKQNVNLRIILEDRGGDLLVEAGGKDIEVFGRFSIDGGLTFSDLIDRETEDTLFQIVDISPKSAGEPNFVYQLRWKSPNLQPGAGEIDVFFYLFMTNEGVDTCDDPACVGDEEQELIFDNTSGSFQDIDLNKKGQIKSIRVSAFEITDDEGNRATASMILLPKGKN